LLGLFFNPEDEGEMFLRKDFQRTTRHIPEDRTLQDWIVFETVTKKLTLMKAIKSKEAG
jgi:hypothetical protein